MSDEHHFPVSDREVKPLWFDLLNYTALTVMMFLAPVLVLTALAGWVSVL
jgi:hypothetical protein